ncbi:MAG: phosphonate utilization associated transcriptional regulator, partial [Paraburkholderia graminis]
MRVWLTRRRRANVLFDVAKFVKMTEYMQTASVDPIEVVRRHSLTALVRDEI